MHYYLIDHGNTFGKIALYHQEQRLQSWQVASSELSQLAQKLFAKPAPSQQCALIYSSVAAINPSLEKCFRDFTPHCVILNSQTPLPFEIAHYRREELGADRVALLAAATNLLSSDPEASALVIDIGTAITYDYLQSGRKYIGGNISPGPQLRLNALHQYTARLPKVSLPSNLAHTPSVGHSTKQAMLAGTIEGIVHEIQGYIDLTKETAPHTQVFLTGGYAPDFASRLKNVTFVYPTLQMDGLRSILTYNLQQ